MNSNNEKMAKLISDLYLLTGLRANIMDGEGAELCGGVEVAPFCQLIQSFPEGMARCVRCDRAAIDRCRERGETLSYRCHAGLCEAVQPMRSGEQTVGYLLVGEHLDESSREEQWQNIRRQLEWYPGSFTTLRAAFDVLDQCDSRKIRAYLEIVNALETYTYMSDQLSASQYTDQQRLERYLDQHYMEKLSLTSLSEELNMGRTKLCALARSMPGGYTISQLITRRRVRAACRLLRRTDLPISEVSEAVGVSDYNYFSKIFRQAVGVTPREYRGLPEAEADRRAEEIQ